MITESQKYMLLLCIFFTVIFPSIVCVAVGHSLGCSRGSFYYKQGSDVCNIRHSCDVTEFNEDSAIFLQKAKETKDLPRIDPVRVCFSSLIFFTLLFFYLILLHF